MAAFGGANPLGDLMAKSDHNIIRDYITGADHLQYKFVAEGDVLITITHSNLPAKFPDIRLNLHMTIERVKERMKLHIGTPIEHQRVILKDAGRVIGELSDNNKKLGFYSVVSGNELHVIDTDPFSLSRGGGLTDVSLVEKYRMTDEDYDQRKGTLREHIREKKAADPKWKMKMGGTTTLGQGGAGFQKMNDTVDGAPIPEEPTGPETVEGITVGSRCEIQPGARRGEVMWVG